MNSATSRDVLPEAVAVLNQISFGGLKSQLPLEIDFQDGTSASPKNTSQMFITCFAKFEISFLACIRWFGFPSASGNSNST